MMSNLIKKNLSFYHVFSIASGAMISSGLFVLPGIAHSMAGPGVIWSYFLAGVLALVGGLSVSELSTAMPKSGGDYFFVARGFGPAIGTVSGILSWLFLSLKSAFAIVGIIAFIKLLLPDASFEIGFFLCLVFILLNIFGVKEAANVQLFLVIIIFILMTIFIFIGIPKIDSALLIPFAPYGLEKIFFTTGFVFVSYGGLIKISSVAEEIKNPGKVIPTAIIFSLIAATIFYMLTVTVASGVLEKDILDNSLTPISDAGKAIMGNSGYIMMTICAMIAFITTANAGIMSASRYLLALSDDGLLPPLFSKINKKFRTPHYSILATAIIIFIGLLLDLKILVEVASIVLILTYILACLSLIILRESRLQNYRPVFKSPAYPWLQIFGIAGFGFILYEISARTYLICTGFILCGFFIYYVYGRNRVKKENAISYVFHRIMRHKPILKSRQLEGELKDIVHSRDNIVKDYLYYLIEEAQILDLDESLTWPGLFESIASIISKNPKYNSSKSHIFKYIHLDRLVYQEPSSALLFIEFPENRESQLIIIKSRKGISYPKTNRAIHCLFVFYGHDDFRIQVEKISGIVQIITEDDFIKKWIKANDVHDLKDILLLSSRKRKF